MTIQIQRELPLSVNPRSTPPDPPGSNIKHAQSIDGSALLILESLEKVKKIEIQRIAVQQHIDKLLNEFQENIAESKTFIDPKKRKELDQKIQSSFSRGFLDMCELRRVERKIGMLPAEDLEKWFLRR